MKKSPLVRKTPLNPGTKGLKRTGLVRKVPLDGGSELKRSGPLPVKRATPRRRHRGHVCRGEAVGRRIVYARSGRVCEICGLRGAMNVSHRKAEGRGGCWCVTNLIDVCGVGSLPGWCHGRVHADLDGESTAAGWTVKSDHDPASVPVVLARWGRVLLLPDGGVQPLAA